MHHPYIPPAHKKMGKKKPECGTCEKLFKYQAGCTIPFETPCSNKDMYVSYDGKTKFCKSVRISIKYTHIINSIHKVNGTFGVNNGVPSANWNDVTCAPYVSYPVPFYLQEIDGNTRNDNIIVASQLFDGTTSMENVANPVLGLDTNSIVVGDSSDRFMKDVFSVYPVTASKFDVDDNVTTYMIYAKGSYKMKVVVQATRLVDSNVTSDDLMFTKVVCVEDLSCCDYRVRLLFNTFQMKPLSTGTPFGGTDLTSAPVFITFVKNKCCEYFMGLFHGVAAEFPAGQSFPDKEAEDPVEFELPSYNVIAAAGEGCPFVSPATLTSVYADNVTRQLFANSCTLADDPDLGLQLEIGGAPITPGNMTTVQKEQVVYAMSEALINCWRTAVNVFNDAMVALVDA
jgi:hypothetical protein